MRLSISRLAILGATAMLAATACGGGGSSSSPGGSASSIVGPSGGTVEGEGVRLDVPEGALQASVAIRIERTEDPAPDGFAALTPLFHFTPEGLTFAKPATVWIEYQGDAATAVVVWSSGAGVEELASSRESDGLTASVAHFSRGFVGRTVYDVTPPSDGGEEAPVEAQSDATSDGTSDARDGDGATCKAPTLDCDAGSQCCSGFCSAGGMCD